VGTTSLRSLESLYWMGVKALGRPEQATADLEVQQWDPYELPLPAGMEDFPSVEKAFESLLQHLRHHQKDRVVAKTRLMITPGYRLRVAKAIITNFHLPGSSLLLLIGAYLGEDWRKVYDFAIQNQFRFFSYGDSSLLFSRQ
jgi:S-adenosylmethionine:tRNA ribosyltransferase-isomerase